MRQNSWDCWKRRQRNFPNERNRRLFHALTGLGVIALALFLSRFALIVLLGTMTIILLAVELARRKSPEVNKCVISWFGWLMRDEENQRLTGTSYFLVAMVVLFSVFPREIAILALAFLTLGDPVAATVGRRFGGRKLGSKTILGSLACFVFCLVAGFALSWVVPLTPVQILTGSACATLAEAVPLPINDNLTIPLFSAGAMTLVGFLC